jgi:hypothetical protein
MADHAIAAGDLGDLGDLRGHLEVVGDPFRLTGLPIRVCLVDAGWGAGLGYLALILDLSSSTRVGNAQPAPASTLAIPRPRCMPQAGAIKITK